MAEITTELSRIVKSKKDIASAITEKGVTVPSNSLISDYNTLIDKINTGPLPIYMDAGEIDLPSSSISSPNTTGFTISHNLKTKPSVILIWTSRDNSNITSVDIAGLTYIASFSKNDSSSIPGAIKSTTTYSGSNGKTINNGGITLTVTETNFTVPPISGVWVGTFRWVAIAGSNN